MYNFSMKSEERCSLIFKYKDYILLFFCIIILFVITRYSFSKKDYVVYFNDIEQDLKYSIYSKGNEQYMCVEDLTSIFKDNIYYDKISEKIIITTYNNIFRFSKKDNNYIVMIDDIYYMSIDKVVSCLGYDLYVQNNNIYILQSDYVKGKITKNRTEIFDIKSGRVLLYANKKDDVKVLVNDLKENMDNKIISVVVTQNNNRYYGYIFKENVIYEYFNDTKQVKQKEIIIRAEESIKDTTDIKNISSVVLDMIRLSSVDGISELNFDKINIDSLKTYAGFNISQKASNFDSDIFTNMVNSEINRELVISKVIEYLQKNKLVGVCVDFSNFKTSDKGNFIQFVKELAASIHKSNKKIIVDLPSVEYINLINYIDYAIINAYGEKTISSKISGPISSITYVENVIKNIIDKNKYLDKIVIEIPTYSVLWTERKGTVINAEIYSMKLQKEYITMNNLKIIKDSNSNQNYINYTKGITTFKMWLEDEESILKKARLVKKNDLAGISLSRSGMEEKNIYEKIVKIFNN